MNVLKKILPLIFSLVVITLLVVFRSVPAGHLWNGYSVLYVPATVEDEIVVKALNTSGIDDYVSLNNQRIPVMLKEESPEISMLKLNLSTDKNNYLYLRNNYFYDSTGNYRLYYIPNNYKNAVSDVIHILEVSDISGGIDSSYSYPWILPVLVTIGLVISVIFSKQKLIYAVQGIIPVVYVYCNPFCPAGLSVLLVLVSLFIINNLWGRKGSFKILLKNWIIPVCILIGIISGFSISVISGIFFVLTLSGTASAVYLTMQMNAAVVSKKNFQMVYIKSARMLSPTGGKTKVMLPGLLAVAAALFIVFAAGSTEIVRGHFAKVLLPGNSTIKSEKLPELSDYSKWNWDVITYPVKSLNKDNSESDAYVVYPRYEKDEKGLIKRIDETLFYDQAFIQKVWDDIDLLDFASIESVLKYQGTDFSAGYTSCSNNNISLFGIIMMIICFMMLLFIYFSVIMKKGGKK